MPFDLRFLHLIFLTHAGLGELYLLTVSAASGRYIAGKLRCQQLNLTGLVRAPPAESETTTGDPQGC